MNKIDIDISHPRLYANNNFVKLLTKRERYIISYGSRDSGKSYNAAQKILFHILTEQYCKVVLLRKIYADIKESQYATIKAVVEDWNLEQYFIFTVSPLKIFCKLNGNHILARGLDKPTRLKSIKDPNIVWAEEADEITLEDYRTTDLSIRSNVPGALLQFILTLNSTNAIGWVNEYFFPPPTSYEKSDGNFSFVSSTKPNTIILHSNYLGNKYCSLSNLETYKNYKTIDIDYYNVQLLGLWGMRVEGLIFPEIFEAPIFPKEEERSHYGIGLDFGFTNHPSAAIECCIAHGDIYLREMFYKTGLVNVTDNSDKMSIDKEFQELEITDEEIFGDGAEPKSIDELKDKGYDIVGLPKPKGSVEAGISALKRYKIHVVGSPNLKKEFNNYKYKKEKDSVGNYTGNYTNVPIDAFNHGIDGVRYWFKGKVLDYQEVTLTVL